MLSETRLRLEAEQEEFVNALIGQGANPEKIDSERFEAASSILKKKRMKGVKKSWPRLVKKLGFNFKEYFEEYALKTDQPRYQASFLDGRLFADFLEQRNLLPEEVMPEIEKFDMSFEIKQNRLYRRNNAQRFLYWLLLLSRRKKYSRESSYQVADI